MAFIANVIYDPNDGLFGADEDTSIEAAFPSVIQVSGINGASLNSLRVEARVSVDADWAEVTNSDGDPAIDKSLTSAFVTFAVPINYVRVVRDPSASDGSEDFVVHYQSQFVR